MLISWQDNYINKTIYKPSKLGQLLTYSFQHTAFDQLHYFLSWPNKCTVFTNNCTVFTFHLHFQHSKWWQTGNTLSCFSMTQATISFSINSRNITQYERFLVQRTYSFNIQLQATGTLQEVLKILKNENQPRFLHTGQPQHSETDRLGRYNST